MAKTYTAAATGIAFASQKSMLGLINAHASRDDKIYRAWVLNNQTAAVTGGTTITPVAHDTGNTSFDLTSVTCVTNGSATETGDTPWKTWMWSSDEPAVSTATSDELQCIIPLLTVLDYPGDANIEPITLNQNEGFHLKHTQSTTAGSAICDLFIEFTVS